MGTNLGTNLGVKGVRVDRVAIDIEPPRSPPTAAASCHLKRGSGPVSARDAKHLRNTPATFERDAIPSSVFHDGPRGVRDRRGQSRIVRSKPHSHRCELKAARERRCTQEDFDLPYSLPRIDHRIGANAGVANGIRNTRGVRTRNGIDRAGLPLAAPLPCSAAQRDFEASLQGFESSH